MVSGNNGDVFVVFNLFTKVDFLVVIGSKALSIFEDQFISRTGDKDVISTDRLFLRFSG